MTVGVLRVVLHVPAAQSLKDRRSVVKRLKDQLRGRFNIAVAEVDAGERWQLATLGITTVAGERRYAEGLLRDVTDWIRGTRLVGLSQVDEAYLES